MAARVFLCLANLSVPFFFLCTGFLLGGRMGDPMGGPGDRQLVLRHTKKLALLYLLWSAVYLPPALAYYRSVEMSPLHAAADYLRGFLLVGEHYNSWMLWYLLASVYGLGLLFLLLRRPKSLRVIGGCALLFAALWVAVTALVTLDPPAWPPLAALRRLVQVTIVNGRLLQGFFYIGFGLVLSRRMIPPAAAAGLLAAGFAGGYLLEATGVFASLCFMAASLGLFCLTAQLPLKDRPVFRSLRTASSVIYFTHMWMWMLWYTVTGRGPTFGLAAYLWTVGLCLGVSTCYIALRRALDARKH